MGKMLWETWLPTAIAKAKEDMGLENIYKYLRYYRMFMERFSWKDKSNNLDLSYQIEKTLFWRGQVMLVKSSIYGCVVCEVDEKSLKYDPNGNPISVSGTALDGETKYTDMKINENCVIIYSDSSRLPPILYIWGIANEILTLHDIIRTQNNMLRKPIMVKGEGASFDNAINKVSNILSSVAWFNFNERTGKTGNAMTPQEPVEVLNLQVGNAYKGLELWDNVKHFEEYICDYLGYTTTKNEKRERMNSLEIENENSIGMTFYKAQVKEREDGLKNAEKIGIKLEFGKILKINEGGEEDDSKENLDRNNDRE